MPIAKNDVVMSGAAAAVESFSVAERDRRYGRVRELMRARGLPVIVAAAGEPYEPQAHSRYLTQIGGVQGAAWAILPLEGEVTAIVSAEREAVMWQRYLAWPSDIRSGAASALVPERLRELGLAGGRIGVTGVEAQMQREEGIVPFETWRRITAALPGATFENSAPLLDAARVVKGAEEVEVIRRVVAANESAITRMLEVARPGVIEADVWKEMAVVLVRAVGDVPARLSLGSNGRAANSGNSLALPVVMEDGGVLSQEIDARVRGYRGQCNHSILVGRKAEDRYRAAMIAVIEVYESLRAWLAPGRTVGQLSDEYAKQIARFGDQGGGVLLHTCGLGSDRPRLGPSYKGPDRDLVIVEGWCFDMKPTVHLNGVAAQIGDPVVITSSGALRLGMRTLEPLVAV